ncbi:hypothetical protein PG990_008973 [Apiospora arundinis]
MTMIHEVEVLLTGFGPYPDGHGGQIDPNTSYTLTQMMPPVLEPRTAQNPSAARIRIARPRTGYIPSEYRAIRQFCHDLHNHHSLERGDDENKESGKRALLVVHLGEARGLWDHYITVERSAFKQGMTSNFWDAVGVPKNLKYYSMPDVVGETVDDLGPCPWGADVPVGLQTAVDVDAVVEKARGVLETCSQFSRHHHQSGDRNNNTSGGQKQEADDDHDNDEKEYYDNKPLEIRPHMEAGFYACGFLYYESLANCYVRGLRRPDVLFCHVPGKEDARSLGRVRDAVLAVIVGAVDEVLLRGD